MRQIIALEYTTIDGVIEAPEKWQFPYLSADVAGSIQEQINEADAILLGRVTYDIFAASWPLRTSNEFGVADKLNQAPKFVVSTTLEKADWHNSTVIKHDVVEEVARLKQQPAGVVAVIGSSKLVRTLTRHGLIDEYRLLVHPVVLGEGKRLFQDGTQAALRLVQMQAFTSGVVLLRYRPDSSPQL